VGEQDSFLFKMDYQTARYAAECARWYAVSQDEAYKEKAFRSLNWVTYCNSPDGQGNESPLSKHISNWWSDLYGECPRMFYQAFAGVPEWAPTGENHILYSDSVLKNVSYRAKQIRYTATQGTGADYLRVTFAPTQITLDGTKLVPVADADGDVRLGIIVARIDANDTASDIARFVERTIEFKAAVKRGETNTPEARAAQRRFGDYFDEFSGKKRRRRVKEIEYISRHGDIVRALRKWRQRTLGADEKLVKDAYVDLGCSRETLCASYMR